MVWEKMYEPVKPPVAPDARLESPTVMSSWLKSSCLPMSIWIAAWFSGGYPAALLPAGPAFFLLWASVCAGTTLNWEIMLQQNFEAAEA